MGCCNSSPVDLPPPTKAQIRREIKKERKREKKRRRNKHYTPGVPVLYAGSGC
jgi:hypothetical protein